MANYDPVTGKITSVPNNFLVRFVRMLSDSYGLLKVLLPLLILIGLFFIIKKYTKNKVVLLTYSIFAIIVYILLLWFFSLSYFYE